MILLSPDLNAVTRAIDLSCKLLAPATAGFIMTYGSDELAAIVIAGWNLFSLVVEFCLLRKVYLLVPALAVKGIGMTSNFQIVLFLSVCTVIQRIHTFHSTSSWR